MNENSHQEKKSYKGVSQAAKILVHSSFRKLWLYELLHGSDIPCEALCHWPAMQAFSWPSMLNQTVITNKSKSVQAPEGESAQTAPQSRRTLITVICNATHLTALQSGTFASTLTRAWDFFFFSFSKLDVQKYKECYYKIFKGTWNLRLISFKTTYANHFLNKNNQSSEWNIIHKHQSLIFKKFTLYLFIFHLLMISNKPISRLNWILFLFKNVTS